MSRKFTLFLGGHLETADGKRHYTEQVFGAIAPRYDFITRALSFGRDAAWKRTLVSWLPPLDAPVCLDLACGTGDLSRALARRYPRGRVTGLDIAAPMLALARKAGPPGVRFVKGDMGELPLADASADIVTGGYALRNAADLEAALAEIARVLKPGGVAAFLDFSKPGDGMLQRAEYRILKIWTGFWGLLFHRNAEVYGYIAASLAKYPARAALRRLLGRHGFSVLRSELNFFGVTEILMVRKEERRRG